MEYDTGFFTLRGPQDLLDKMRFDYKRLERAPDDSYAAFDFFVTASHMHEWLTRYGAKWETPADPKEAAIFRLCGEIGNGAKHFVMEHKVAQGHEVRDGFYDPAFYDPHTFDVGGLWLNLNNDDAALFGRPTLMVLTLAASVLLYWEADMHRRVFPLPVS